MGRLQDRYRTDMELEVRRELKAEIREVLATKDDDDKVMSHRRFDVRV